MDILPSNLRNSRGYRSPFINNLNANVTANRVVGGDVIPSTEINGTTLTLKRGKGKEMRWEIFTGISPEKTACIAVGDGSLFIDSQLIKLENAVDTKYVKEGLLPRGRGWYFAGQAPASTWTECEIAIYKYTSSTGEGKNGYYMLFVFDGFIDTTNQFEHYNENDSLVQFVKIGKLYNESGKIEQYYTSDIYFNGGTGDVVATVVEPWCVKQNEGVWQVYAPNINVMSAPSSAHSLWSLPNVPTYTGGTGWVGLTELGIDAVTVGYLNVYYTPFESGSTATIKIESTSIVSTSRQFTVGQFLLEEGVITFKQMRQGYVLFDVSQASPPYVANRNYQGIETPASEISNSASTAYIGRTHWLEKLTMGSVLLGFGNHTDASGNWVVASMGQLMVFRMPIQLSNSNLIQEGYMCMPSAKMATDQTIVAMQENQARVQEVATETPTSEKQQGRVYAKTRSSTVWVAQSSGQETETDLLYTEVELANDKSTYEDSSGLTE